MLLNHAYGKSNAEKWLPHTKSGLFFEKKKNGGRVPIPAFLKNGRHVLTFDIFKKAQAF